MTNFTRKSFSVGMSDAAKDREDFAKRWEATFNTAPACAVREHDKGGHKGNEAANAAAFSASLASGLRVAGDEQGVEGIRHRRRYAFFANRIKELSGVGGVRVVLDHGCGAGYGTRMLANALQGVLVYGYDPDPAAVEHATVVEHAVAISTNPYESRLWKGYTPSERCIATLGVLEHIVGTHPSDMLEEFLGGTHHVVGFFPYREPVGNNHNHFWFGLDERVFHELDCKCRFWFEPWEGECSGDDHYVDGYYEEWRGAPRPSAWESGNKSDPINLLFVLEVTK